MILLESSIRFIILSNNSNKLKLNKYKKLRMNISPYHRSRCISKHALKMTSEDTIFQKLVKCPRFLLEKTEIRQKTEISLSTLNQAINCNCLAFWVQMLTQWCTFCYSLSVNKVGIHIWTKKRIKLSTTIFFKLIFVRYTYIY